MPRVVAVAPVLPPHTYRQSEIADVLAPLLTGTPARARAMARLHAATGVTTRHLALPLDAYPHLGGFDETNRTFHQVGARLAGTAVRRALDDARLRPQDVDLLLLTSVTGIGAPSLDATLVTELGLRPDVVRIPTFGLGCAGGAAGLGRLHDHLVGHPEQVALLVSVELCSLTLQRDDDSAANLVATGLFGDGAAAVVMTGDAVPAGDGAGRPAPRTVAAASHLEPGTAGDLGWDIGASGFRIVLGAGLPDVVRRGLRGPVERLLDRHDLKPPDVTGWVVHTGGPRILDAVQEALDLDAAELAGARELLAATGNLSSASVLHGLARALEQEHPPGSPGVLMAFGPGVSTDLVLLRWSDEGGSAC
ncbi:type III polyketide synthase [Cellulomonas sp. APG4]|uniref:type III polyketide synthase n=1 Tax=Cellulomonas sp. APG4 TaxID=1538656 RepID=UPI00137B09F7|nr:3-oxoacyl-[acyl-carrier-protein] synthase III C-terminal domain-containing protein [Cellulomonas sp. APG4]NCT90936.1 type III polyketide synthase [Cellulomonas sp. APG4]